VNIDTARYPFATADPSELADVFAGLRATDPLPRVVLPTGDEARLVTRYEHARTVLGDARFSRNLNRPEAARLTADGSHNLSPPFADPPAHTRWRRLVSSAFTARHVAALRPRVQSIVDGLVDQIAAQGPSVDLMDAFAFPMAVAVICGVLGIPVVDQRRFRGWVNTTLAIDETGAGADRFAGMTAMAEYTRELVAAKRADLGDDLISSLVTAGDDTDRLTDDELLITVISLVVGGYESTAHQIGKGLLALFGAPEQLAAVRANAAMIPAAVEETLRYASFVSGFGTARVATEDLWVGDVLVPSGTTLLVVVHSANRDEAVFVDPERLDIGRACVGRHITFGLGTHFCVGAALARLELQVAFGTLLARLPRLRLAVPVNEVRWEARLAAVGPRELPVTW